MFFGLRQHGTLPNGFPATEQVYVHSKLLVIDDDIALVGSANINDRSLLGHRDAELAVVVEDRSKVEAVLDGRPAQVSECVRELRLKCFQQIFGLSRIQVEDPLKPEMWLTIEFNTAVDCTHPAKR